MTGSAGFPTYEAERRLRAARAAGVEPVPLHGSPSPALPPHVVEAVAAALGRPMAAPPSRGLATLREAYAPELERSTGRTVDPESELLVTNGAMHALGICMRAFLRAGDEVVVPAPCFFFDGPIRAAGGVPVYVHGSEADGWRWDAEAVERAIGARTTMVLLCNPGNPTGYVPAREDVAAVVACAVEHGLLVVADEAYEAAFWGDARLTSAFGLADDIVVIRSLGKSLSMPQLRLGIVSGPAARVEPVRRRARVGLPPRRRRGPGGGARRPARPAGLARGRARRTRRRPDGGPRRRCRDARPLGDPTRMLRRSSSSAPNPGGEVASGLLDAACPSSTAPGSRLRATRRLVFGGAARAEGPLRAALARWAATAK